MKRYYIIDYARGGRALRGFDTRDAAAAFLETVRRPDDPKRYRVEAHEPADVEELTHA